MKTSSFPSPSVDRALREATEAVSQEGETPSNVAGKSVRAQIDKPPAQEEFIARGLSTRKSAKRLGDYVSSAIVLKNLEARLAKTKMRRR